jgi:hypothetical protein
MGKVITGKGLQEFIASGKTDEIKADPAPEKKPDAPKLEVVPEKPVIEVGKEPPKDEDIYAEEDQETRAEVDRSKHFDRLMRKKHWQMKKAQEEAAKAKELAEE